MKRARFLLLLLFSGLSALADGGVAKSEIAFLLKYIETANVKFVRSGKSYTPQEGAAHLRSKLAKAGNRIKSAEDFIEGIASRSYLTGDEYQVASPDGRLTAAGPWLTQALAKHRARK